MNCLICKNAANVDSRDYDHEHRIVCEQCGTFVLKGYTANDCKNWDIKERLLLSHYINHSQIKNNYPEWDADRIRYTLDNRSLPKPHTQMEYLIQWLGDNSEYYGHELYIDTPPIISFTGCNNDDALFSLFKELSTKGLIHNITNGNTSGVAKLLMAGWNEYERLQKSSEASDNVFMAMKFGDKELNTFLENHLKPAISKTGYNLFKLDDRPEAGLIDIRIRQEIKNSKFIIADLTHHNLGAYWEAGFAEGIGKQVIYTCEKSVFENKDTKPHFDVNHHLTVIWDKNSPENACEEIKAAIRYTFPEAKQED